MLARMVPDIQKTAELVQEITASTKEQEIGSSQINKAIQELDRIIQQNASASEEMASTAEELSTQADQLQETISFFTVKAEGAARQIFKPAVVQPAYAYHQRGGPEGQSSKKKAIPLVLAQGDKLDMEYESF